MKKLLFLLCISVLTLSSCSEKRTSSKLYLRQLVKGVEVSKSSSGGFFLFMGGFSSSEQSDVSIKCFANVGGRYRLMTIPYDDIRIVINDSITTPYILVEYSSEKTYTDDEIIDYSFYSNVYVIYCPERYLPEKLLPIGL